MGEKWWPNGAWNMHPGFFYMQQICDMGPIIYEYKIQNIVRNYGKVCYKEADIYCKFCDRSCARGGVTLEREFGLTDFILRTVSCWPRDWIAIGLPILGLADSVFCIVHLHCEVTLKQLIKLPRLYFDTKSNQIFVFGTPCILYGYVLRFWSREYVKGKTFPVLIHAPSCEDI